MQNGGSISQKIRAKSGQSSDPAMAALLLLGRAAFDPAGSASPARLLVSDSYLFRYFAEEFAYQQPVANRLFVVTTNPASGDNLCRILDIRSDKWLGDVLEIPG